MSDQILPTLDNVQKLMQCLLGNGVQAKQSVTGPDTSKPYVLASYVDESDRIRRVLTCDLGLANSMGAAISMIPAGLAADSTKAGAVPDNIKLNLHEVLNICVNLFTEVSRERLTLKDMKVCAAGEAAPAVSQSIKFNVQIPKYSGGIMLTGSL
jgi:hypothetical protein